MLKTIKLLLIGILGFFLVETLFYTYFIKANNLKYDLTTVYNVLPVLIIYDNIETFSRHKDVPEALNFGFVIVVNKNSNKDFLIHELTHAKQYYRYCLMAPVLYALVQRFRVLFEYEAYMS